jgi:hypothetical protein
MGYPDITGLVSMNEFAIFCSKSAAKYGQLEFRARRFLLNLPPCREEDLEKNIILC